MLSEFKNLVNELKLQYFQDGDIEVFDIDNSEATPFLDISNNISHLTMEKGNHYYLISKITPKVCLQLKAHKTLYNVGILKSISMKISNVLRSNAVSSSK